MRLLAVAWMMVLILAPSLRAAEPKQIDQAIQRAKAYLYSAQKSGTWEKATARTNTDRTEPDGGQWGGTTALCTYALLASGEQHEDERLKPAIQFLLKADIQGMYALAMRTQVWNVLPKSPEVKLAMQRDMQALLHAVRTEGPTKGFYDYLDEGRTTNRVDHSVSQFGVLGVWACAEYLEDPGPAYWKMVDDAWRSTQQASGAWCYERAPTQKYPPTLTMTAAGVATLFITQDFLNRGRSLDPMGNQHDASIEKGIKWISDHYNELLNNSRTTQYYPFYGLYGIERVGVASGYRFLGNVNWYQDGAEYLVKGQKSTGGWGGTNGPIDSALALIFLARGRAPVVMNKLDYTVNLNNKAVEGNWNQRPRDAANLAKYIGRQAERTLNWQIIDFKASVEEMLDAPILYISGNQPLAFSAEQKDKLKQFVEQGGLIVAHADAANAGFANSIRRLGTELFKYEFRALPAGHVIYTNQQFVASRWRRKPNVLGLSNGVRELILLLPDGDAAKYWQAYDIGGHAEVFELAANVFQYSVDKQNLRNKGENYLLKLDESIKPGKSIAIARISYNGNWDPEPAGWTRLAARMNNVDHVGLTTRSIDIKSLATSDARIAHMTGTGPIRLDQAARDAVKAFVTGGGTLIVDSAGGSAQFSESIEQEFDTIFGDDAKSLKQPLPADHAIYTAGAKIPITYRPFARRSLTGDLKSGRIRGLQLNGRLAVIYSPEDLSAGLVGQAVDGIIGYEPETATSLMAGILRFATSQQPGQ